MSNRPLVWELRGPVQWFNTFRPTVNREKDRKNPRNDRLDRVPYMLVIGAKEVEEGTVSVRHRDNEDLVTLTLEEFTAKITTEIKERSL